VHEAFLVETETLKDETEALTIQAEARPRPRPSEFETETRPRRTNSEARPSRGTSLLRLETASRPRLHPCLLSMMTTMMMMTMTPVFSQLMTNTLNHRHSQFCACVACRSPEADSEKVTGACVPAKHRLKNATKNNTDRGGGGGRGFQNI